MTKILFLIHDLGEGGAEKVLVNLVNNMDTNQFDITIMTLFDVGVNKQFLNQNIKYKSCFSKMIRGNSHLMKLLSPNALHRWFIRDEYDIEVAYLEGPCARVISGCQNTKTKLVSWIHIEQKNEKRASASFRTVKEAIKCYNRFHKIITVSQTVKEDFTSLLPITTKTEVLYNTNESKKIIELASESVENDIFQKDEIKLVGVGKLLKSKGFDRLLKISKRLREEGYPVHLYILGMGPEENNLKQYTKENNMDSYVNFLGYQTNPYRYVAKCDLFVCASHAEGFSTAATEALILRVPVCTVEVSGMKEMLGENNEYGLVVENNDEALYQGIKRFFEDPGLLEHYTKQSEIRGKDFGTEKTVRKVEKMLISI